MRKNYAFGYLLVLLGLTTTGCTVYAPLQPYQSLIRAKGEGEVMLQTQVTLRPTATVAYSPLNHLLVAARGEWRPRLPLGSEGSGDSMRTAQYEWSVGGYQNFGPHWTSVALLGAGQARVQRMVREAPSLFWNFSSFYEAHYQKKFGQLGLTYQKGWAALSFGYRQTHVAFQELTASDGNAGTYTRYELPLDGQVRHEPFLFWSVKVDSRERWVTQGSLAYSFCYPNRSAPAPSTFDNVEYRARFNRGAVLLLGVGITYNLHGRRSNPVTGGLNPNRRVFRTFSRASSSK